MGYKKLYSFLKQRFWCEFDILNQKFINLSKSTSSLTAERLKNYKIHPIKTLIYYYHLFGKFLNRINYHKTIYLFLISICRFELVYTEDKLIFLETHLKTKTNKSFFKTYEFFLVFIELINYELFVYHEKKNKLLYQMFVFLMNFIRKIKNTRIKNDQLQTICKKTLYKSCNNVIFNSSYFRISDFTYKLYNFVGKILNKNSISYTKNSNKQKKDLYLFNSYDSLLAFLLNSPNIEKKNWFNIKNTSRFRRFRKKISFLEKIQSYDHINYIYSFYYMKRTQSNEFSYLLIEKILKKYHRFSYMSRFKYFFPKELNSSIDKFFSKYSIEKKVDIEKQILRPTINKFLSILYSFVNKISKNKKIALIYSRFLIFIDLIKYKLKR